MGLRTYCNESKYWKSPTSASSRSTVMNMYTAKKGTTTSRRRRLSSCSSTTPTPTATATSVVGGKKRSSKSSSSVTKKKVNRRKKVQGKRSSRALGDSLLYLDYTRTGDITSW